MTPDQANRTVADAISSAMSHCKSKAIDEQTLRTALLTITIANFVNGIGRQNTIDLFSAIPAQIQAGTFDRYVNEVVEQKAVSAGTVNRGGPMPSNFIAPQSAPYQQPNQPQPASAPIPSTHPTGLPDKGVQKRRMNI